MHIFKEICNGPKIIGVIGDVNTGKTMLLYHLIDVLQDGGNVEFNLFTYGLKVDIDNSSQIHSVEELEQIKNSVIIIDEVITLFDLDNRMQKQAIENTFRLIHHNNNLLILCLVPENVKKFLSGKINVHMLKRITLADLINGSRTKQLVISYKGPEKGSSVLNLPVDEALIYDGNHYKKVTIPYTTKYDTKKGNKPILRNVNGHVNENVNGNVSKKVKV